jgi:hypothetical protein
MSTRSARLGTAAIFVVALAALLAPAAWGQTTTTAAPSLTVDPNAAPPGSTVKLTLSGFDYLAQCNVQAPTRATCIYIDFVQGSRVTTIATANGSNPTPSDATIRPACTSPTAKECVDPGPATVRATSPNGQTASAGFTVLGPGVTTTKPSTTTSSSIS